MGMKSPDLPEVEPTPPAVTPEDPAARNAGQNELRRLYSQRGRTDTVGASGGGALAGLYKKTGGGM